MTLRHLLYTDFLHKFEVVLNITSHSLKHSYKKNISNTNVIEIVFTNVNYSSGNLSQL